MKTQSTRARLLASSMIVGAVALAGGSAFAQSTTPQTESNVSEVVVTGSRIPSKDFTANSPYVSVNADTIKQSGSPQIDTLLNQLPQFVPALTTTSNNPSSGGAGGGPGQSVLDLRGLGTNRNLVLLNGRRLVPTGGDGSVNVNLIPASLIERVEIITGGASAVYGSDAISGVVNFILKDHYQGAEVTTQYGISSRGDGREWAIGATMGGNFADDKGNVVLNVDYDRRDNILQGARPFSAFSRAVGTDYDIQLGSATIGSGRYDRTATNLPTRAAVEALFATYGVAPSAACSASGGPAACGDAFGFNANGTLFNASVTGAHFQGAPNEVGGGGAPVTYNFGAVNNLTLPFQRYNLFASGNYSIWGDYLKLFMQALYTRTDAYSNLAPTPVGGMVVPVTNPYIPTDLATLLASRPNPNADFLFRRRFTENGLRIDNSATNAFQILGGFKGTFQVMGHDWNWEGYFQNGKVQNAETETGNLSISAIQTLLESPTGGVDECGGFNVFGAGNVSAGCAAFIGVTTHNTTTYERNEAEFDVAGTLWDLPAGPLGIALGADWRNDRFDFSPDAILASGDVVGFGAAQPVTGGYKVGELYGEVKVPILADRPFFHYLGLEAGYRISSYSTDAGTTNTWKYGGEWAPTDWLRFRGLVQQAIRAPSLFELFSPQQQGFPAYNDPCNASSNFRNATSDPNHVAGVDPAQVAALCQAQGVPASLLPTFGQTNPQTSALFGGNPHLKPETAHTWTAGAVFTPGSHFGHWLESFRASVDYFHINITDAIAAFAPDTISGRCFNADGFNPSYSNANPWCQLFSRDASGDIQNIVSTTANVATLKTSGVDAAFDYRVAFSDLGASPSWGGLRFNLIVSWLESFDFDGTEFRGTISQAAASSTPVWKGVLNTTWNFTSPWGPMSLSWRENYVSAMDAFNQASVFSANDSLGTPAYWLANLSGTWNIKDNVQLFGGVNNLLDKQPPVFTGTPFNPATGAGAAGQAANTDPTVFDVIGRYFFLGVTAKF